MSKEFEAVIFILNKGHVDEAMDAARNAGARGGTVLHGRGVATDNAIAKMFAVNFQPEKELLLIICDKSIRNVIMSEVGKAAGLNTPGAGVGFSLPVEDVIGLSAYEETYADCEPGDNKLCEDSDNL